MMKMRENSYIRLLLAAAFAAALCLAAPAAGAVSPYPVLAERAARYFDQKEWNQAAAVYGLMLDERPEVAETYGLSLIHI